MKKRADAISETHTGNNSSMNRASALTDFAAKDSITIDFSKNMPLIT